MSPEQLWSGDERNTEPIVKACKKLPTVFRVFSGAPPPVHAPQLLVTLPWGFRRRGGLGPETASTPLPIQHSHAYLTGSGRRDGEEEEWSMLFRVLFSKGHRQSWAGTWRPQHTCEEQ